MDYITRRDVARTYGCVPAWTCSPPFERLRSAGPRVTRAPGMPGKHVVSHREVEVAFADLKLTHLLPQLPPEKLIDPEPIEAALVRAGLTPAELYNLSQSFLKEIGAEARSRQQKNQDDQ